jgi:Amt family ammonium transporter
VLLGAALLWFGWFGFNGGSALGANESAVLAFVNTMLAPAATLTVWMTLDFLRDGRATAVGGATGIVVGLVAITPAAGFVGPMSAMAIGAIAALPSYWAILRLARTGLDDSLDVAAAHGVGGLTGALLTGLFARAAWGGVDGLLFGNPAQFAIQVVGVVAALAYSAGMSWGILVLVGKLAPLRADARDEGIGLDVGEHGEEAYTSGEGAVLISPPRPEGRAANQPGGVGITVGGPA